MDQTWFRDYVLLAFCIDKSLRAVSGDSPFVDYVCSRCRVNAALVRGNRSARGFCLLSDGTDYAVSIHQVR
jgi:hypothetical protein